MLAWLWLFLRSSCRNGVLPFQWKRCVIIKKTALHNGCGLCGHSSLAVQYMA